MFARLLEAAIRSGRIDVIDHTGRRRSFGSGAPAVAIRLHDPRVAFALALNPWLKLGEAYMDGRLTVEEGSLYDFVDIAMANSEHLAGAGWQAWINAGNRLLRFLHQHNPIARARRNVAHHYDLDRRLFALFLDPSLQYSCAYFPTRETDLAAAQAAKMRHIAAKLLLRPGLEILDIGCGWGGLALFLARFHGVRVTGVTLSREQLEVAQERARALGLESQATFKLQDYRLEREPYDRIVSVGMFEHVGLRHYPEFFAAVHRLLKPDGIALLHSIGRRDGPGHTNPWLRKYIFPGGYSPALSEVLPAVERSGLHVTDIEILRLHYAETLKAWRGNFERNRAAVARLYDERFCRMWELYLIGSELSFRHGFNMVFQMQMTREVAAAPLTRDYMLEEERAAARAASPLPWPEARAAE